MKKTRVRHTLEITEVLDLILSGDITVDTDTATIYGRNKKPLSLRNGGRNTRHFVCINYFHGQKVIAVHKIVWMAAHKGLVPANCEIHHKDRNRHNNVISNLELQTVNCHRREHSDPIPL